MALDTLFAKDIDDSTKILGAARAKAFNLGIASSGATVPSIRSSGTDGHDDAGETWTFTLPTHQTNDIIIIWLMCEKEITPTWTPTTGWTAIDDSPVDYGTGQAGGMWIRATSASMTDPVINVWDGSGGVKPIQGGCIVVQDCITTGDPFDVFVDNGLSYNGSTFDSEDITPTVSNGLLVCCSSKNNEDDGLTTPPPPSGYSLGVRMREWDDSADVDGCIIYYNTPTVASNTISGVTIAAWTAGAEDSWTKSFVLKPAA